MKTITIEKMNEKHLEDVTYVEESIFPIPWSYDAFKGELSNDMANYYVAVLDGKAVGFAGMWHIINEGHITNIGVLPEYRGYGIGSRLIKALLDRCTQLNMIGITLEVRISNTKAQKLYTSLGFKPEGIRKHYYEDNKEDAIIMWKTFDYS